MRFSSAMMSTGPNPRIFMITLWQCVRNVPVPISNPSRMAQIMHSCYLLIIRDIILDLPLYTRSDVQRFLPHLCYHSMAEVLHSQVPCTIQLQIFRKK